MFNIEELERQLERLVDGELPEQERTRLLWMLDEIPDGWKRCACAFLRSQCYQEVLDSIWLSDAVSVTAISNPENEWENKWKNNGSESTTFTPAASELSDDETFREWVRKQCATVAASEANDESIVVEDFIEEDFSTNGRSIMDARIPKVGVSEVGSEEVGSEERTNTNVDLEPAVTMTLREGGVVVAREPVSSLDARNTFSEVFAERTSSAKSARGTGTRAFRRMQRYAMRNWAAWSGTIAAVAISFMLGSWYMNPRTLLPLSPEDVSQLAANLPANQTPGPPLVVRYGQSEAVDTASQEAERRGVSNRILNGDAAAMMQAVMQSRSVDSSNNPNNGRAMPTTDLEEELAITTSTDPQTGTVYYHSATESSNDSTTWSTDAEHTGSGYLTLESELEFEKYYDYDKGTWNLVAVFDGEQNPERSQNAYILSDASVAMLRAAGYEVVQQSEMVIQNDSNNRPDGAFIMSEIPVTRTQIRYVGP